MSDDKTDQLIRSQWRELGFYFRHDERERRYRFAGSKEGLARFCQILTKYAQEDYNDRISEHQHYGPYHSLEIMTWDRAGIDSHAIHGTLDDLRRLASLVSAGVARTPVGASFAISTEYAPDPQWTLRFEVQEDTFDPGLAEVDSPIGP
jgi:hypothetical protein